MTPFDQIFDPAIRLAAGSPGVERAPGLPGEETGLERAADRRLHEFRAGRALAREAMRSLGAAAAAIPVARDRAPIWPEGIVGSITHCHDLCAAAVARKADGFLSIGLDVEPAEPLDDGLLPDICVDEERLWLATLPASRRGLFARTIFSAKECAYKCQYPLSRKLLDFHAMTIGIDCRAGSFVARFNTEVPPFSAGDSLPGRFTIDARHIVTAMALTADAFASGGLYREGEAHDASASHG